MLFWIIIAGILALTLILVWRSWTSKLGADVTPEQSELALYNARLKEIVSDLAAGKLDTEMADVAKAEEARKLLKSQNNQGMAKHQFEHSSGWWMTLSLFSIPFISVLVYLSLGTPPYSQTKDYPVEIASQSMEELVASAERRLASNADDLQGWQVLIPVYLRQKNYEKAEIAFQNVIRIEGENTHVLSAYGEALVAKSEGQISSEALALFNRAIELDARNASARFFSGLFSFQNGDQGKAKLIWQAMIDDAQGDEDWLPVMKKRIEEIGANSIPTENQDSAQEILNLPADEQRAQVLSMVAGLAARLNEDPNDQAGWIRLIQAYMVLGQNEEAEEAAQAALVAFPRAAGFEAQLKQILAATQGVGN